MDLLDEVGRREVSALMAYKQDRVGGLMNPHFARIRPEITADEAIAYLRLRMNHCTHTPLSNFGCAGAGEFVLGNSRSKIWASHVLRLRGGHALRHWNQNQRKQHECGNSEEFASHR